MQKKEYCYKIITKTEKIFYIGCPFGLYHVFVTNKNHTENYSLYGGYKNLGTASNKMLNTIDKNDIISYYYATKELILKNGAFGM